MRIPMSFRLVGLAVAVTGAVPIAAHGLQQAAPVAQGENNRVLPLQGGQNFRDLGGYRTRTGRTVRWGVLYRSGSMHFLTPADFDYLATRGIRTVCDFRTTDERSTEPVVWPAGKAPRVLADDYAMDTSAIAPKPGRVPTAADAKATMTATYPALLTQFNGQYRRMFGELLAGRVPLAFNCTAGKDRTGVAAALILTALDVPRETVIQDYLLTNKYFDPRKVVHSDDQASQAWRKLPTDVLQAYMAADRDYIEAVFAVMDRHRGGVNGYLQDELGLGPVQLAKLRASYTR
jgi:protein-tyrosine phosphatase